MGLFLPPVVPEKGFYRHFEHNPETGADRMYLLLGLSENLEGKYFANYIPLYKGFVYTKAHHLGILYMETLPLDEWLGEVPHGPDKAMTPRFTLVTDETEIGRLRELEFAMYSKFEV